MPEYPDLTVYVEALERHILGSTLTRARIASPTLLRSVDPPLSAVHGMQVTDVRRLAKRLVIALEQDLRLVLHLMIAGRLRWKPPGAKPPGKRGLAAFDFEGARDGATVSGTLILTEASSKKRASLYVVRGDEALADHDPGGLEVMGASLDVFSETLTRKNHTLKRALTDPHIFAAIGNAYSDEILHRAGLSPIRLTQKMTSEEIATLHGAVHETLEEWVGRLRAELGDAFPDKVTAFHKEMAVHGRYGNPCPTCGAPVQRIVHAKNETNYCAPCQTGGKLLADRALSRLLKRDWPRSLEELEERKSALRAGPPVKPKPAARRGVPGNRRR